MAGRREAPSLPSVRRIAIRPGRSTVLALLITAAVGVLAPQDALAGASCSVSGTTLKASVTGDRIITLGFERSGEQIRVIAEPVFDPRTVTCSGVTPTVSSIDSIAVTGRKRLFTEVVLDLRGGSFGPGATAEPDGSAEIEFRMTRVDSLTVLGSPGKDEFRFGRLDGAVAANLNAGAEASPDADVSVRSGKRLFGLGRVVATAQGRGGADVLTGNGGPEFGSGIARGISLYGGSGDDSLTGTRGDDLLTGLKGADKLRGLAGSDGIQAGPGADRLYGDGGTDFLIAGRGPDRLFGGRGRDFLFPGAGRDRVFCGPGRDFVQRFRSRTDLRRGCEKRINLEGLFD
jgi:hypothetical protein